MRTLLLVLMLMSLFGINACTERTLAKDWGGTARVDLPSGTKLITELYT